MESWNDTMLNDKMMKWPDKIENRILTTCDTVCMYSRQPFNFKEFILPRNFGIHHHVIFREFYSWLSPSVNTGMSLFAKCYLNQKGSSCDIRYCTIISFCPIWHSYDSASWNLQVLLDSFTSPLTRWDFPFTGIVPCIWFCKNQSSHTPIYN